jgi:hypothetical protein
MMRAMNIAQSKSVISAYAGSTGYTEMRKNPTTSELNFASPSSQLRSMTKNGRKPYECAEIEKCTCLRSVQSEQKSMRLQD